MEERFNFSKIEEEILDFWEKHKIFEKSLKQRKGGPHFIFFEGPPGANGFPGIHHMLSRSFKDAVCRYKTMKGFYVRRQAGWDTHGLPIELSVEKELGFKTKQDIEKFGIAKFNKKCKASVWKYKEDWEKITKMIGFWLDLKNPYITYDNYYIETLWWIIKKIAEKKLLYKDYKVVPYCYRCGTPLSSHEVALGYQKVKDFAVYVKFKIKSKNKKWKNSSILCWTTTPWTLPGNTALAVNPKHQFIKIADPYKKNHWLILELNSFKRLIKTNLFPKDFKERFINKLKFLNNKNFNIFSAKEIFGLSYKELFKISSLKSSRSFKVYPADFVTADEGTGVVHIAPMYGEDDYNLGKENNLPKVHVVNEEGKFTKDVKGFKNLFVKDKETEEKIINYLKKHNFFFGGEFYSHSYPFCWRCSTPLLYYAKSSWFIKISKIKDKLIKNNQKINWIPNYIKEGRFGEWLREIRDWAISRERYWATPLPVWKCEKCKNQKVIGSLKELEKLSLKSENRYFILRHGEAKSNHNEIVSSWPEKIEYHLTEEGKRQVKKSILKLVEKLKKEKKPKNDKRKIDIIFSSDLLRAKETTQTVVEVLKNVTKSKPKVIFDKRLREIDVGVYNGKKIKDYQKLFKNFSEKFKKAPERGETLKDVQKRMFSFIKKVDRKYKNKNILIVSHADPLRVLEWLIFNGDSVLPQNLKEKNIEKIKEIKTGNIKEIKFKNLSYDENGNLDLHRPYIDEVEILCQKCGFLMRRVQDVVDVWFDSGAMPFAKEHWPFGFNSKNLVKKSLAKKPPKEYPADFIAEGIDQTRGWFYTLLAVSTLLDFQPAYKNVISLGLVLDKQGKKMSKSKGNIINPKEVIEKFGADSLRWYFYIINNAGDLKLFNIDDLAKTQRKFFVTLLNSYIYFDTYGVKPNLKLLKNRLPILDSWILARLNETILLVEKLMDSFDLTNSTRVIENLVDDLSRWYIRRSRERFSSKEKVIVSTVLYFVLLNISKIIAPFTPFFSEFIYQKLKRFEKKPKLSVHLCNFSKSSRRLIKKEVLEKMNFVRKLAYLGLKLRAQTKIKVRQPLSEFYFYYPKIKLEKDYLDILKEELNVKKIISLKPSNKKLNIVIDRENEIIYGLNIKITPKLKNEGLLREIIRNIQELRKKARLTPKDKIFVGFFSKNIKLINLLEKNEKYIKEEILAKVIYFNKNIKPILIEKEIILDNKFLRIRIKK